VKDPLSGLNCSVNSQSHTSPKKINQSISILVKSSELRNMEEKSKNRPYRIKDVSSKTLDETDKQIGNYKEHNRTTKMLL